MSVDGVTELCRLCYEKSNLVWVFDDGGLKYDLKNIIYITTAVEIQQHDFISQKICQKCRIIVLKMYQFRKDAMVKDELLKKKYEELLQNGDSRIPNTNIIIKSTKQLEQPENKQGSNSFEPIHTSVSKLFKQYPNIKLPSKCLYLDMAPIILMTLNKIENPLKNDNKQKKITDSSHTHFSDTTVAPSQSNTEKDNTDEKLVCQIRGDEVKSTVLNNDDDPITRYKIVKIDKDLKQKTKSNLKRNLTSVNYDCDRLSTAKKRRCLETKTENITEISKTTQIASLGLTQSGSNKQVEEEVSVTVPYVKRTLSVCNICSAVHYNPKELKRHQLRHLRCQFCKVKFKTMKIKEAHIENECVIKKIIHSFPDVYLSKIEFDVDIRHKYPDAFTGFPPLPGLTVNTKQLVEERKPQDLTSSGTYHVTSEKLQDIEIISDGKESRTLTDKPNEQCVTMIEKNAHISKKSENITTSNECLSTLVASKNTYEQEPSNKISNLKCGTIKPDFRIKNRNMFDVINMNTTDTVILKELLKNYIKTKDIAVQLELPSNISISNTGKDNTTILKQLKHQLNIYRIPVEVKNGVYKVEFDYTRRKKKNKQMCLWNHMTPIDLKTGGMHINNLIEQPVVSINHIVNSTRKKTKQVDLVNNDGTSSNVRGTFANTTCSSALNQRFTLNSNSASSTLPNLLTRSSQQMYTPKNNSLSQQNINSSSNQQMYLPKNNRLYNTVIPKNRSSLPKNDDCSANQQTSIPKKNNSSTQQTFTSKNITSINQKVSAPNNNSTSRTVALKTASSINQNLPVSKNDNINYIRTSYQQTFSSKTKSSINTIVSISKSDNSSSYQQTFTPKNKTSTAKTFTSKIVSFNNQHVSESKNDNRSSYQQTVTPKNLNISSNQHMSMSKSSFTQQTFSVQNEISSTLIDNNKAKSPAVNSINMLYQLGNIGIIPQTIPQSVSQTHKRPSQRITPIVNTLLSKRNSTLYNSNTPTIISNSVTAVVSSTSNVLSTTPLQVTPIIYNNLKSCASTYKPLTTLNISSPSSSSGISSLATNNSFSSDTDSTTFIQSPNCISTSTPQNKRKFVTAFPSSNSKENNVTSNIQTSTTATPFIRVKNLNELS